MKQPGYDFVGLTSKDADLREYTQTLDVFKKHMPFDTIIHVAANVGGLFKNMRIPVEMYEDNMRMNMNVLRAAHELGIQRVVCFLSTCIFPDCPSSYPITFDMLHEGPPHPSNEGYAYAKRMTELHCRLYQKQYGRDYFCVVPTNIYGPGDNFDLKNAHVIPALIHKCWLAKRDGIPFVIAGDGTPLRQFIYSEDVARLTLWALENYKDIARPMMICPPNSEVALGHVVRLITEAFDFKGTVEYDTAKPNGQHRKTADTSPVVIEFTSLEEGIQKTVDSWLKINES
jgi:GDP-L-fucose synthase